ncbi:cAMP-binding domain of CRP or a regulatory subunit of cAMP-dependent protein kinases [Pedobacter westerhofensis]|uniref:cAMP-binding domain of CRP or a regulatory subunit of cAMP-dependent protein kinases n=1 Tax=Pedobacter westerhofensis TaxID=425512 RepID=A0A521CQS0_9SPHI|nr:Crp/Fnr family transcriptional regulator [Pedobacter westerhofensis]SMO61748.1 cAMP-binding domain of CRP or a regulatory subunit of cAMP-dependent protein kinases [Pedobacter westerhofensis]
MFEIFKEYINSKLIVSEDDWMKIESLAMEKTLHKKEYLLKQGSVWRFGAFVCTGCLRTYRLDTSGHEHTTKFTIDKSWTGDISSIISGKPAVFTTEALEDTTLVLFYNDDFDRICREVTGFQALMNADLRICMSSIEDRVNVVLSYSAEEKYHTFMEEYPGLSTRIPQYMIASYLGITPESLSRLRKQIAGSKIPARLMTGT